MRGLFPWEFGYIVDEDLRDAGVVAVRGRPHSPHLVEFLEHLARDHLVIGITCQGVFPMIGLHHGNLPDETGVQEGRDEPYLARIEGWAHCFRNPDDYLPAESPRILFANSDNLDADLIWRLGTGAAPVTKKWDFLYTCMPERTNLERKNWDFARRCVTRFAEDLGLRGVLVGLEEVPDAPAHPLLDVMPQLPWREFLPILAASRVAFLPNTWDPSPRVMAEAMILDVPLLVNRAILGGWHYVVDETGSFFSGEEEAMSALACLVAESPRPRQWYLAHHGRRNAGPKLAAFVNQLGHGDRRVTNLKSAFFYSPHDYGAKPPRLPWFDPAPQIRPEWLRWLARNKLRGVADDDLVAVLVERGFGEAEGRRVLELLVTMPLYEVAKELSEPPPA